MLGTHLCIIYFLDSLYTCYVICSGREEPQVGTSHVALQEGTTVQSRLKRILNVPVVTC